MIPREVNDRFLINGHGDLSSPPPPAYFKSSIILFHTMSTDQNYFYFRKINYRQKCDLPSTNTTFIVDSVRNYEVFLVDHNLSLSREWRLILFILYFETLSCINQIKFQKIFISTFISIYMYTVISLLILVNIINDNSIITRIVPQDFSQSFLPLHKL